MPRAKSYDKIVETIFHSKFARGKEQIDFERTEIVRASNRLRISLPKNLGDVIYSYRYRALLPESIRATAPKGRTWIIRGIGRSKYRFVLVSDRPIAPNQNLTATKVPDATPGVIAMYALNDEQALLARIRYNRLIDIFSGVVCHSLQNHLRTTAPNIGQVETDEIYVGLDRHGAHYVFPVQAKARKERLGVIQIEQDIAVCQSKFPGLICRPIGAQFIDDGTIVLFEFGLDDKGLGVVAEKHYRLVPPEELTEHDLESYRIQGAGA